MATKKKILILLGVIFAFAATVAGTIFGTVAYMTSASKVSNVFTVGDVEILLDETLVDSSGNPIKDADGNTQRTDRNSYHLMPGKSYLKDPSITVKASTEASYIFLVTRNQITSIEAKDKDSMAEQMYKNGWAIYKDTSVGSRVWVYCGTNEIVGRYGTTDYSYEPMAICGTNAASKGEGVLTVAESTPIQVFTQFHISSDPAISSNLDLYSGAEVTINAVGIQADTFVDDENGKAIDKAWAAVIAQYPYIQDNLNPTVSN